MAIDIIMPKLEMAQDSGTVVRWLKEAGSLVQKGEPLLEIETSKVTVEVESPGSGVLGQITAEAGVEVPVGQVIARLLSPEEANATAQQTPASSTTAVSAKSRPAITAATPVAQRMAATHNIDLSQLSQIKTEGQRITKQDVAAYMASTQKTDLPASDRLLPASPLGRRLAQEKGLDLGAINGSGPGGAVLAADVRAARPPALLAAAPGLADNGYRSIPLTGTRKVIATRLQQSYQTAPHIALTMSVDTTEIGRLIAKLAEPAQQEMGKELTLTTILARIVALALKRHPRLNAHLVDQEIREFEAVHLGIAVALADGLVVPVIRNAQEKGLVGLQTELSDLALRARGGKLALEEIQGGTFTISNLGMFGIEQFTAILNPPEVGILAVGTITPSPVEIDGQLVMRPFMRLTLMVDHRAVDGAVGAQFLATLKTMLENPYRLLM